MLKKKIYKKKFKRHKIIFKLFIPNRHQLVKKKKIYYNPKKILIYLKKLKKFIKKNFVKIFIFLRINHILSFKSKNARMGKGKGNKQSFKIVHFNQTTFSLLNFSNRKKQLF